MNKKFMWLIVSCLMVAALILASCGPAPVVEEKKATVVTKEPEKKAEKVEEVEAKPVGPQYGGWVNLAADTEIASFDNIDALWQTARATSFTHENMVRGDWYVDRDICAFGPYEYRTNEAGWTGCLVESWDVPDNKTLIWHVRKGVRWQNLPPLNGREFVANDIVQHFKRLLAAPRYQVHRLQTIKTIIATDKYTVRFDLDKPLALRIVSWAGEAEGRITAHELWETYGDLRHWTTCIGTGPFIFEDFVPSSSLTFKRNPDFWEIDPTTGNQLPYVDGVRYLIIPEVTTRFAAVRTAKIDLCGPIPWTMKASLSAVAPELQWLARPETSVFSLWLRNSIEPFNNLKVRQALTMAINQQEISDTTLPLGLGTFASPVPESWYGIYIPFDELSDVGKMVKTYDPVAAKALLAEAGYPTGFKTSIQYYAVGKWAQAADGLVMVKEYWDAIGVDLELRPVDAGTMSSLRYDPFPYDHILGVAGGWWNPYELLQFKFYSGAQWNRGLIRDPKIDAWFDEIEVEFDSKKQIAMFRDAYNYILEECMNINLPFGAHYQVWWPWFKGFQGEQISYGPGGSQAHIWLDQDLREEITGRR